MCVIRSEYNLCCLFWWFVTNWDNLKHLCIILHPQTTFFFPCFGLRPVSCIGNCKERGSPAGICMESFIRQSCRQGPRRADSQRPSWFQRSVINFFFLLLILFLLILIACPPLHFLLILLSKPQWSIGPYIHYNVGCQLFSSTINCMHHIETIIIINIIEVYPVKDIAFKLLMILGIIKIWPVDLPLLCGR